MFGTVGYMSPEQASGGSADFRADQFAFGAILYEMATGSRAFHKDTGAETLSMIIRGEPERPLDLNPSLPLPLVWIIERCLSKDPADRYVSTRDLARDLQTLREHATHRRGLEAPRLATRIRRPWLVAAAVAVAAAERCRNARVLRDAGRSGRCSRERAGANLPAAHVQARPDTERALCAGRPDDHLCRRVGRRPDAASSKRVCRVPNRGRLGPRGPAWPASPRPAKIALIQNCQLDWASCVGTLATMPLAGGAPREVLEDVVSADWTPDGQQLAAIQITGGEYQLQFPIGKSLYETQGKLGWLAFSPRGDRLAFIEYPLISDEAGSLKIVDLEGRVTTLSSGGGPFEEWIGRHRATRSGSRQAIRGGGAVSTRFR